jgi:phage terminase large subunit-like protein
VTGDALHLLHALVLEDGRRWGEAAADFQREDAAAILEPEPDAPAMHFLTRPRGGSKTSDLAGMAIAAALEQFGPGDQGYAVAADADQAALLVDAAGGFVMRTTELAGMLTVERRRIVTPTGAAVNVLPADGPSAFGLRGPFFVVDEIAAWASTPEPRRVWEAVVSAVPKRARARLVLLTTAGDPAHWSRKVLEVAVGSPRWRVHEVPGPVAWIDPADLDEQRKLLTPSQFARLHLNVWTAPEDRLTTVDDVEACVGHDDLLEPQPGARYVIGVDIGLTHDRTAISVCHSERVDGDEDVVVLDRLIVFEPTRERPVELGVVEAAVEEAAMSYGGAPVVFDPFQAVQMVQRLRNRGLTVKTFAFSQQSVSKLAMTLFRLLRARRLRLPRDAALLDELAHVRMREMSPGVFRLDHDADRHDDRTIALALAAHTLVERPREANYDWAAGFEMTIHRSEGERSPFTLSPWPS